MPREKASAERHHAKASFPLPPFPSFLKVSLGGRAVGTLAETPDGTVAFEYDEAWLTAGFSISPFSLPLESRLFIAKPRPFDGLFGAFDDSLPDGWGRLLVDRLLRSRGIDPLTVPPLARLAIVGQSGMGALEYEPAVPLPTSAAQRSLDELADECAEMLRTNDSDDVDTLFALGGSSGGARPKAFLSIDGEDWIVKFPSSYDTERIGEEEFAIANAAQACGLQMPEVRLLPSKTRCGYFAIKRFDRALSADGSVERRHMLSAGALLEASHRIPCLDYDLLMRLTMRLTESMEEVESMYRLMAFNVAIGNRDDHAKNFTFIYDEGARTWRLSPAYDLTSNPGMNGEHTTTVNGKGKGITFEDVVAVGTRAGLGPRRARFVASQVDETVRGELRQLVDVPGLPK